MANLTLISTCLENELNQGSALLPGSAVDNSLTYNLISEDDPCSKNFVVLNVAGKRFETYRETLSQFPETLLGDEKRLARYYNSDKNEYFLDRNQISFQAILYYYQSGGVLYVPSGVPREVHYDELDFFRIPHRQKKLPSDASRSIRSGRDQLRTETRLQRLRYRLWEFLDLPESSLYSRAWALLDVFIILLSILIVVLESMPQLRSDTNNFVFSIVDTMCVAFFTFDFTIRLIICPSKITFIRTPLNVLDFLAILPFYMELALGRLIKGSAITTFKVLRIFRIMRVMKLIRHSRRLILMGRVIQDCFSELILLLIIWLMGVLTFGTVMYYLEHEQEEQKFKSILHSCWWAVVTISTVGYGDMVPESGLGKLFGSCLLFISMVYLALPMTVIVSKFNKAFEKFKDEDQTHHMGEGRRGPVEQSFVAPDFHS